MQAEKPLILLWLDHSLARVERMLFADVESLAMIITVEAKP